MRLQRGGLTAAAILVLFMMAPRAEAVILASDDFSGPGSGTGWEAGNDWEGLGGGVVSTAGGVASFRDFAAPIDGTNQVTYIRFDFTQSVPGTGAQWGGASFFEGTEGAAGNETFFAGDPGQQRQTNMGSICIMMRYGAPLATHSSPASRSTTRHTRSSQRSTRPPRAPSATYRLWVDNFNINAPTATLTVATSPIDAPWSTFRMNSDATNTDLFDNLTIATTAREVGLVPEPASLGLIGLIRRGDVGYESPTPLSAAIGAYRFDNWKPCSRQALPSGRLPFSFSHRSTKPVSRRSSANAWDSQQVISCTAVA